MLGSSISPISDEIICPMQQEYAKLKLKKDPWYGITIKKIKKKSWIVLYETRGFEWKD